MKKYCFGIDIGGTTIKCGFFTAQGELLEKWEIPTRKEDKGSKIPQDVADTIAAKIQEKGIVKDEIAGVGLGVPGPVGEDGTVHQCANLGWGIINIKNIMEELTGLPVQAGNDANVAALGEMWQGGGRGFSDVVMVTLGTGVGGGVILDGRIRAGVCGAAGEIGHIIMEEEDTDAVCGCGGHGHLEQYASATGIVRMAKKKLAADDAPSSLRTLETITAKDVFDHAKAGDQTANDLVDMLGRYLGMALYNIAAVVDPQVFVIGGGVSRAGDILLNAIEKHYNENGISALLGKEFRLATLGNDAGIFGCARMLLD
ncbi:MAG: ROK family glucokinase [Lachnospiraceae bacterium]|nr:ROK family glucokinase [Lachnospiraceae bacterium]